MADEVQSNAGSELPKADAPIGGDAPAIQPSGGANGKLAGILAKQARGEKLNHAEIGFLGGIRRKKKPAEGVSLSSASAANPLLEVPRNPDNPLLAPQAASAPAADSMAAPVVDSGLLRKTANALCSSIDRVTRWFVGKQAKAAGGDKLTVEKYKDAVLLQAENRDLIVENSEPAVVALCKALNCAPEKLNSVLEGSGLILGLTAHFSGVAAALEQIREDKIERQKTLSAMETEKSKM